jgi:hypothetical protein
LRWMTGARDDRARSGYFYMQHRIANLRNRFHVTSMRAAVAQWDVWSQLRREWARAHGLDVDCMDLAGDAPWDPSRL